MKKQCQSLCSVSVNNFQAFKTDPYLVQVLWAKDLYKSIQHSPVNWPFGFNFWASLIVGKRKLIITADKLTFPDFLMTVQSVGLILPLVLLWFIFSVFVLVRWASHRKCFFFSLLLWVGLAWSDQFTPHYNVLLWWPRLMISEVSIGREKVNGFRLRRILEVPHRFIQVQSLYQKDAHDNCIQTCCKT